MHGNGIASRSVQYVRHLRKGFAMLTKVLSGDIDPATP